MNKIILQFGFLTFTLAVIFFSRIGLPFYDVFIKSFLIFLAVTVMLSLVTIIFIRAVNKTSSEKNKEMTKKI
jgi:energy-coupling factor transporter transmembrane protein EcfT